MGYKCMWPKTIWIRLFEQFGKDPKNVNVVVYKRADHAHHIYGRKEPKMLWQNGGSPLSFMWNWSYLDLDKFANVVVDVPKDTTRAVVKRMEPVCHPSFWRYRKSEVVFGTVGGTWLAYKTFKLIKRFR